MQDIEVRLTGWGIATVMKRSIVCTGARMGGCMDARAMLRLQK
jgi:hypothetical protein